MAIKNFELIMMAIKINQFHINFEFTYSLIIFLSFQLLEKFYNVQLCYQSI